MSDYDPKIDLAATADLWGYAIVGDDPNGAVDLEFGSLVSAAGFVNANDILHKTSLTFPDRVTHFGHTVTITVHGYREVFKPLS